MSAVAIQRLLKMWTEHSLKLQNMKWSSREGQGEPELHHRAGCMVWTLTITLLKKLTSRSFKWGVKTFLSSTSELTEFLQGHDKYLSGSCVIRFFYKLEMNILGLSEDTRGFESSLHKHGHGHDHVECSVHYFKSSWAILVGNLM